MSALFGHVKGAFTGGVRDRPGLLLSANDGFLFLDEVGELGLDEQAMLLRALEEKRFLPLGSDKEVSSDFQLIAGTNRDLADAVQMGRFREDLLARINLWTFSLPGLVDRVMPPGSAAHLDRFDRVQLEDVLHVCRSAISLSAAGRALFDRSRERKKIANDADRLRKYLARFDLDWGELKKGLASGA